MPEHREIAEKARLNNVKIGGTGAEPPGFFSDELKNKIHIKKRKSTCAQAKNHVEFHYSCDFHNMQGIPWPWNSGIPKVSGNSTISAETQHIAAGTGIPGFHAQEWDPV